MKKASKQIVVAAFLLVGMFASCSKDYNNLTPRISSMSMIGDDEEITLGEQIEDPYRLETMQRALDLLMNEGVSCPITSIEANGVYMRLLPNSKAQDSILDTYADVTFFDFPLDYELPEGNGHYYHDPSVVDTDFTWQYCVVDPDVVFPSEIEQEVLYDVFIPDLDCEDSVFYMMLEDKAFYITGNADDDGDWDDNPPVTTNSTNSGRKKWEPSVQLRVYDTYMESYVPLSHVKVVFKGALGCKQGEAYTDENGYCKSSKSFRKTKAIHYYIEWDTPRYSIRSGRFGQAWTNGPTLTTSWVRQFESDELNHYYGSIHRAAYRFFYGDRLGAYDPNMTLRKVKIAAVAGDTSNVAGHYCSARLVGFFADIYIENRNIQETQGVIGTTLHEIAHLSHKRSMGLVNFENVSSVVKESWASAVAWCLLNDMYGYDYTTSMVQFNTGEGRNDWYPNSQGIGKASWYTPIFVDLIDNYNQLQYYTNRPNDLISGYSLQYIQNNIVPSSYGLNSLYNSIKSHKIQNVTDSTIDLLFDKYWGQEFVFPSH